jgi:F-type H+-transporting ATPase subunit delta
VSAQSLARRYATALFDVATRNGTAERAAEDLARLAGVITGHDDLMKAFETPAIPVTAKTTMLSALLKAAGDPAPEVGRLLMLLAERGRMGLLADVAAMYADAMLQSRRVVPADVVTAAPMSEATRSALVAALGRATGTEVVMTERVDSTILGGVVARVGSVVFDGSVSRQLERLRHKLLADA